jgi:DNA processing protein
LSIPPGAGELPYWLALHRAPTVGSLRFAELTAWFGSPRAVFEAGAAAWREAGLPAPLVGYLSQPDWRAVESDLHWLEGADCQVLLSGQADYPPLLAEIPDPPAVLFVRGNPAILARRHVALVGSRNPTPAGVQTASVLAWGLATAGYGVVSGLALGIDAAGHRGALDAGGATVAVMGTGPDLTYPPRNAGLAEAILAAGSTLATEFPPGTGPRPQHFPRRNRIISGLALGLVVVEAAQRSGSLISARLAAEQNREVFAVPGSIFSPLSRGCHDLIRQGAKLVQVVEDILEEFGPPACSTPREPAAAAAAEGPDGAPPLLKFIAYGPTSVDTLVAVTGESAESIAAQLLLLELQGYVAAAPGGSYVRLK